RVGRDASAVAQTTCELAVIDRAAAEGRFGEPPHAAKLADLLEDLFVHGALPAGLSGRYGLRANQLRFLPSTTNIQLGKVGNMGGQVAHRDKALWFQNNRRDNSRLRLVTTEKWNMAHSQDQPCGHCGQASCRLVQTICRSDVEENRLVLALHP